MGHALHGLGASGGGRTTKFERSTAIWYSLLRFVINHLKKNRFILAIDRVIVLAGSL
jgi:hypothetical protein